MAFRLGETVGGYEFLEVLGTSEIDVAYKVRNHLSQRLEALKVLAHHASAEDREGVERFLREIKVHARLLHPNIVTFYTAAELEGQLVMTTELVEGITLTQRLKQMGPLQWCEVVSHLSQVLLALGYAHEQGIVHRNVTPDSIILTADATVKLSGFGLAKSLSSPSLTQAGSVIGALKYIPPEQIRGVGAVDARGDLYSAGVVLYEALTGQLPFDSSSQFQVMLDHVVAEAPPPSVVNPRVPAEFDSIVQKALSKDPNQRFQNADQFRIQLEAAGTSLRAKSGAAVSAAVSAPRVLPPERPEESESAPAVERAHSGARLEVGNRPGLFPLPESEMVPAFCATTSVNVLQRNLVILGISSVAIGMAVAVLLSMAHL